MERWVICGAAMIAGNYGASVMVATAAMMVGPMVDIAAAKPRGVQPGRGSGYGIGGAGDTDSRTV